MKTITIKLPEEEAHELETFVKKKNYVSKSEFIRHLIMDKLDSARKEKAGWLILAQKSLDKMWNNSKDDEVWNKYL
ncbi:MAG: ribbon-helix-helix domain-containing protein [Nanoarchaeota archaeon]